MTQTIITNFAFRKGYDKVRRKDLKRCRESIMQALGIGSREGFYKRLNGVVEPKVSEAKEIERIFNELGIKDIWGF